MREEGLAEIRKCEVLGDPTGPNVAWAYAVSGMRAEAIKILQVLKERSGRESVPPVFLARIYAALGEKEQAFTWLEKAYQFRAAMVPLIRCSDEFEPLHSDPRYQNLLRRMRLPP